MNKKKVDRVNYICSPEREAEIEKQIEQSILKHKTKQIKNRENFGYSKERETAIAMAIKQSTPTNNLELLYTKEKMIWRISNE